MPEPEDAPHQIIYEKRRQSDPVTGWLMLAIGFVVVLGLVGVIYGLLAGVFGAGSTPRTLVESQVVLLRDAARQYPGSGSARQAYILALEASGQPAAATKEYKSALTEVKGVEKTAVYAAGVTLLFDAEDYKGAIDLAKEGIASDDAARKEIITAAAAKQTIVTDAQFDQTHRILILFTSARASGVLGDWKTAEKVLSETLRLDPQGSDLLVYRASAHEHLGEKDKALADYKAALAYIPNYEPALDGIKRIQGE